MKNKNIALIILVLLVAVGGSWYAISSQKSEPSDESGNLQTQVTVEPTAGGSTSMGMYAEENALVPTDQQPGENVVINRALLANTGYVVVHENVNDGPGKILGVSNLLEKGEHEMVEVKLTRTTKKRRSASCDDICRGQQ